MLIAYGGNGGREPTEIRNEILFDRDVAVADLFDASKATPTLGQLQQYDIVMVFGNGSFSNATTLGDNLAAYVDGGGVTIQTAFSFSASASGGIHGRWATGNYCPYNYSTGAELSDSSASITNPGHPLMAGVTTLNSRFYEVTTLAPGAASVAVTSSGDPLVAYRPVSGGHTTIGITGVLGNEQHSGDWGKVIVNAGRWLRPCGGTSTPTPTPTATPTPSSTPTATPTATATASATPPATPTPTPGQCQFRVLIAYVDFGGHAPNAMRDAIRADPDVAAVDLFDASIVAPTLPKLRQYDIVMLSSNGTTYDPATLGDNLAAYVDGGGVVVECAYSFPVHRLQGRWLTGNYNPFDASETGGGVSDFGAYIHDPGHPLMAGVTTLNLSYLEGVTVPAGATKLASAIPGGSPLISSRPVSGGHTTVGVAAFLGFDNTQSGDWGKLIVNAGRWLRPCGGTPTPTPTATPTPSQCQFRVLVAYVDLGGHVPNEMREQIRLDRDVAAVDLFDASAVAPTLAKLQQYDIVMLSTNGTPNDPATLGDNLAAYVDGGGVVVECAYSFPVERLQGRWLTGNYSPFNASQTGGGVTDFGGDIHNPGHPLMAGVTRLYFTFLEGVTLPAGATKLASAIPGGTPLIAYRPVSGGHTTVGVAAFLGFDENQSGDWGKLIVNAGRWLHPCGGAPTPSPTATATAAPTATPTATATAAPTATANPSATAMPSATATATPSATPTDSQLANISTRMRVEAGDNVLIAGFIVEGTASKKLIVRGIGPSLSAFGIADALQDPTLELFSGNTQLAANDNWPDNPNAAEIVAAGLAPTNAAESTLLVTLAPGTYTAALRGNNSSTGVGLVEVYDLDTGGPVKLVNISTRGFVLTGESVMIGGLIITGSDSSQLVIRALGPSLGAFGVPTPLADPLLELHDGNGATILSNNNWRDTQGTALLNIGLAPSSYLESAILISVAPGNYTAIVKGADGGTGNGLVEVYNLAP